jgi:amino-acid N-acetyltransferase
MNKPKPALKYHIRTAHATDITNILDLINDEVKAGRLLPRNEKDMRKNIKDWRVASQNDEIIGCVSLVFYNIKLCEIRSLVVSKAHRENGLGKNLIEEALVLAKERGAESVLTLTRAPRLFEGVDFRKDKINNFPDKVQQDCLPCPFLNNCDEFALLYQIKKGEHA